jgi:predicted metal-dependent peptidase
MFLDSKFEYRFFADVLINLKIRTQAIGTLAVSADDQGRITLLVDEKFFNQLSFEGKQCLLAHEVLHIVLQHINRGNEFLRMGIPQYILNIAADLAVNSLLNIPQELIDEAVVPGYGIFKDFPRDLTFEEYVKELLKRSESKSKSFSGDKLEEIDKNRMDSHETWGEIPETSIQDMINKAREIAKRYHGNLPQEITREIETDYVKRFNWKFRIKSFVSGVMDYKKEITYGIPNRRFPDRIGEVAGKRNKLLGNVMVFVDTSGSITDNDLKQFISVALSIPYPKEIYFIDAEIHGQPIKIRTVTGMYNKKIEAKGGGGTDFRPAFELAKKKKAKAIVYFTDMFGTFPEEDCGIPTAWVTATEDVTPPFGEIINIRRFV